MGVQPQMTGQATLMLPPVHEESVPCRLRPQAPSEGLTFDPRASSFGVLKGGR